METTFSSASRLTSWCVTQTDIPRLHFNLVSSGGRAREAAARLISHTHSCRKLVKHKIYGARTLVPDVARQTRAGVQTPAMQPGHPATPLSHPSLPYCKVVLLDNLDHIHKGKDL